MSTGAELIAAERQRQIDVEGWTAEHDAKHDDQSLIDAAHCYLNAPLFSYLVRSARPIGHGPTKGEPWTPDRWPWQPRYWKPRPDDRIRELVKAGALVAAEIDRLSRSAAPEKPQREATTVSARISAKIIDGRSWRIVAVYDDGCVTSFPENRAVTSELIEESHANLHAPADVPARTEEAGDA